MSEVPVLYGKLAEQEQEIARLREQHSQLEAALADVKLERADAVAIYKARVAQLEGAIQVALSTTSGNGRVVREILAAALAHPECTE